MKLSLPELLWYGNETLELPLPDEWEVEVCRMRGAGRPELERGAIAAAIRDPIGAPPIRELAAPCHERQLMICLIWRYTPGHPKLGAHLLSKAHEVVEGWTVHDPLP